MSKGLVDDSPDLGRVAWSDARRWYRGWRDAASMALGVEQLAQSCAQLKNIAGDGVSEADKLLERVELAGDGPLQEVSALHDTRTDSCDNAGA
jgi:hypothetical protein